MFRYPLRATATITREPLDTRNAFHDHIGLQTVDTNVSHECWPCVSHPKNVRCRDAIAFLQRKPFRALTPAPRQVPSRDFLPPSSR